MSGTQDDLGLDLRLPWGRSVRPADPPPAEAPAPPVAPRPEPPAAPVPTPPPADPVPRRPLRWPPRRSLGHGRPPPCARGSLRPAGAPGLYVAGGTSGGASGYVAYLADPFGATATSTLLPTPPGGLQVIGVAAGHDGANLVVVITEKEDLSGNGVYSSTCSTTCTTTASWTAWAASTVASPLGRTTKSPKVDMWWPQGSSYLYLFDPNTGVWRSNGTPASYTSFTKIWALPSPTTENSAHTDHLAGDPASAGKRIYFTTRTQAYVIDDASTCSVAGTACTVSTIPAATIPRPGAVGVDPAGTAFIAELPTGSPTGTTPALYRCTTTTTTCDTPVKVSDDATYAGYALFPNGIAVASDGTAFVPTDGSGMAVVLPRPQG